MDDFKARMAAGRMGHVGLPESIGMVLDTLGHRMTHYETAVEPIVAERPVMTAHFRVEAGQVRASGRSLGFTPTRVSL